MAIDKAALLEAIAQAGTRGAEAYKAAQASLATQQAEAIRMALANGIASSAPQGAQDELSRIISQPYQNRAAQLTSNEATMTDYYGRLGAASGTYMDQANALIPAIEAEWAKRAASGSGGGSGGGGGGGDEDWWDALSDRFDTKSNLYNFIRSSTNPSDDIPSGIEMTNMAREFGIPDEVALAQKLGPKGWLGGGMADAEQMFAKGVSLGKARKKLFNKAVNPAHQRTNINYILTQTYGRKKPKKRRRG